VFCRVDLEQSTVTLLECPRCGSGDVFCHPPQVDPTGHHPEPTVHQHECGGCGLTAFVIDGTEDRYDVDESLWWDEEHG
jgi:ribosomal protein S27AE